MRKIINFGLLVLSLILSSCLTVIELEDYLYMLSPFILTSNIKTGLTESESEILQVNSEKWKR